MDNPLVSIILPTFNRAHLLRRTIASIFNQTYGNFEIVIVDDCSTDDTREVVASINSSRITYTFLDRNVGPSAARNVGIRVSKGEYVAFQDSDDEWYRDKLEEQMGLMTGLGGASLGACYSKISIEKNGISDKVIPQGSVQDLQENILSTLLYSNVIGTPSLLARRSVLLDVGLFDERLTGLEDWDLALRIARHYKIGFINRVLVLSHWSPTGVNSHDYQESLYYIILKNRDIYAAHLPKRGAFLLWLAGHSLIRKNHLRLGRSAIRESLQVSFVPYRQLALLISYLGNPIYGALALLWERVILRQYPNDDKMSRRDKRF